MSQGIHEQIGPFAAVKAKTHFFKVGREMLGANPMPSSHNAALQERESILDSVRQGAVKKAIKIRFPNSIVSFQELVSEP